MKSILTTLLLSIFIFNLYQKVMAETSLPFHFTKIISIPCPSLSGFTVLDVVVRNDALYILAKTSSSSMGSRSYLIRVRYDGRYQIQKLYENLRFEGGTLRVKNEELYFGGKYNEQYGEIDDTFYLKIRDNGIIEKVIDSFPVMVTHPDFITQFGVPYDHDNILKSLNPGLIHYYSHEVDALGGLSLYSFSGDKLKFYPKVVANKNMKLNLFIALYKETPLKIIVPLTIDSNAIVYQIHSKSETINIPYEIYNGKVDDLKQVVLHLAPIDGSGKSLNISLTKSDIEMLRFKVPSFVPPATYRYKIIVGDKDYTALEGELTLTIENSVVHHKAKSRYICLALGLICIALICISIFVIVISYSQYLNDVNWNFMKNANDVVKALVSSFTFLILGYFIWESLKIIAKEIFKT